MKTKRLIPIILVVIMLLNAIAPFVNAVEQETVSADTVQVLNLNSKLYTAIKTYLTEGAGKEYGVVAKYNDQRNRITITQGELEKVTEMNLVHSGIADLTGLEYFVNLTYLNISGNELTKDSNLEVLSKLTKLEKLDISTNYLSDVTEANLKARVDSGALKTLVLQNQQYTEIQVITPTENEVVVDLPPILEFLTDLTTVDLEITATTPETNTSLYTENMNLFFDSSDTKHLTLKVASDNSNTDEKNVFEGLLNIKITVHGEQTLKESVFDLHYVVIKENQRAAVMKDQNLYDEIKAQLTKNQNINNFIYKGNRTQINEGNRNPELRTYIPLYSSIYEEGGDNLYEYAYDEIKVFVFDIDTLINDIPSLKLSNIQAKYLDGLETFVGLKTELDLSRNYIESIDGILALQENKKAEETLLRERFKAAIEGMKNNYTSIDQYYTEIKTLAKEIKTLEEQLNTVTDSTQRANIQNKINEKNNTINVDMNKMIQELNYDSFIPKKLKKVYKTFNKMARATSILTLDLKQISNTEFYNLSKEQLKALYDAQVAKIRDLENNNALSEYEKNLLLAPMNNVGEITENYGGFGIQGIATYDPTKENPISEYFASQANADFEKSDYIYYLKTFYRIGVKAEIMNYIFLEQENDKTDQSVNVYIQLAEQYIEEEIKKNENAYINNFFNEFEFDDDYNDDITHYTSGGGVEYSNDNIIKISGRSSLRYCIGKKLMMLSDDEINAYILLPRLEKLDLSYNIIESIAGIENLSELKELYLGKNEIENIANVDWNKFEGLEALDLSYNFISDISSIGNSSALRGTLTNLDLSNNLLEGKFDFPLSSFINIRYADFSMNSYTDISNFKAQYFANKNWKNGNEKLTMWEYLTEIKNIDVNFGYQRLNVDLGELSQSERSQTTVAVKLPPIIEQFEEIDPQNTAFGYRSILGSIREDGTVTLVVNSEGSGQVTVENGMGYGTVCNIVYQVNSSKVDKIQVVSATGKTEVEIGNTLQLAAIITSSNIDDYDNTVSWRIEKFDKDGNSIVTNTETAIDENGLLTVAENETAAKIKVVATSNYDTSKSGELELEVKPHTTVVEITTPANGVVIGKTKQYTAKVTTTSADDTVTWSITRLNAEGKEMIQTSGTFISEDGLLTVSNSESASKIIVKATSNYDAEAFATVEETVYADQGEVPVPQPQTDGIKFAYVEPNSGKVSLDVKETEILVTKPGVTVGNLLSATDKNNHELFVKTTTGENAEENTKLTTGMNVTVDGTSKYKVVLLGDVNEDGIVNSQDSSLIKAARLETVELTSGQTTAADINRDGQVNRIDSFLLLFYRSEKISDFSTETINKILK